MKTIIVKASELGLSCWLPIRFAQTCFLCDRYSKCKYPEKVKDKEFDRLVKSVQEAKDALTKYLEKKS